MVNWIKNKVPKIDNSSTMKLFDVDTIEKVRQFHSSFPGYSYTPLVPLKMLSVELKVGGIYVKDESYRFGLNSFKGLGASFALASFIAESTGQQVWDLDYNVMTSPEIRKESGDFTFFACTDGNHGRGLAWAATQIGQKSVIYMCKGCPEVKLDKIKELGAEGYITDLNYDDTIRYVAELASKTPNGVIIQDTAWEGYTKIPTWIMQGYAVTALEACQKLDKQGILPTHMILQAGVGAFAGAAAATVRNFYRERCPVIFVVEPTVAGCFYSSAAKGDGSIVNINTDTDTIMAGLNCGEPNPIAWDILSQEAFYFATIEDNSAATAMRVLGAPLNYNVLNETSLDDDTRIVSGESGASGMGFLLELLTNNDLQELRESAGVDIDSKFLVFSTEGDTDPENYRKIVWNGAYSSDLTEL